MLRGLLPQESQTMLPVSFLLYPAFLGSFPGPGDRSIILRLSRCNKILRVTQDVVKTRSF